MRQLKTIKPPSPAIKKLIREETPGVLNELAICYTESGKPDSASYYLDQLVLLKKHKPINDLDIGINHLYRADILAADQHYLQAIQRLQYTIIVFAGKFTNSDIYTNPYMFEGSYTYFRPFDALCKKAHVFEQLYHLSPHEQYLTGRSMPIHLH